MKRFVSPIGFSPHLVTRPIIANGISTGDQVELIRPEQPTEASDDRATNAIDDVRTTLSGVVSDVNVDVVIVDELEFELVVDRCSEILMEDPPPVVCLGAGATDIHFPLTVAAIAHSDHIVATMLYSDLKTTANTIDLPSLTTNIPGRTRETFQALGANGKGEMSIAEIADATDVSRSTAGRHVQTLEDRGFVTTDIRQKEKITTLTMLGRLIARNML